MTNPNVDETLFGSSNTRRRDNGKEIGIVGKDTVYARKKMNRTASVPAAAGEAVIIASSELNRLRESAKLLTKEEEHAMNRQREQALEERAQKSKERKDKIKQIG